MRDRSLGIQHLHRDQCLAKRFAKSDVRLDPLSVRIQFIAVLTICEAMKDIARLHIVDLAAMIVVSPTTTETPHGRIMVAVCVAKIPTGAGLGDQATTQQTATARSDRAVTDRGHQPRIWNH